MSAASLVMLTGVLVVGQVTASANAADPANNPAPTGNAVVNSDGTVTVTANGSWTWQSQRSTAGSVCGSHYGVGWAMIWNDTTDPGYSVSGHGITVQVGSQGNSHNAQDDAVHYDASQACGATTSGGYPAGLWGPMTHVYPSVSTLPSQVCVNMYDLHNAPAPGSRDYIADQNDDNSVTTNAFNPAAIPGTCFSPTIQRRSPTLTTTASTSAQTGAAISDTAHLAGSASNAGGTITFKAYSGSTCSTLVYTSGAFPVNGDGSYGPATFTPVTPGTYNWTAAYTGDASTNPASESCGSANESTIVTNPAIQLALQKLNAANGSGSYAQTETAPRAGAAVPFRVTVTNNSEVAVVVDGLTDTWPGLGATINPSCPSLVGVILTAGAEATCDFTLANYAPSVGSSLTNTAVVTGHQQGNTGNSGTAQATSTVNTGPGTLSLNVQKLNDANGRGYAQTETAIGPGENVPFRAIITNGSAVGLVVDSISDVWPGAAALSPNCAATVLGTTLAPGASATCDFTLSNYAPPAAQSLTNTVTVLGHDATNPANTTTRASTSTVKTPAAPGLSVSVSKTNNADGSGNYAQTETATGPGESVPFRVTVSNTSTAPVVVDSISDVWPGANAVTPACAQSFVGATIPAGGSLTCDFMVNAYAPGAGLSLTDTVTVTVHSATTGNPARGTATSTVNTPGNPPLSISVVKTNDAGGTGSYAQTESASAPGQSVAFRAVITNTSPVPVVVDTLTDSWPNSAPFAPGCAQQVIGATIPAGGSTTCDFTVANYAPAGGQSLTDTVTVTVHQPSVPGDVAGRGSSTVNTTEVLPLVIHNTISPASIATSQGPLAFTGLALRSLLIVAGLLLLSGALLMVAFRRERERAQGSS